MKKKHFWGRLEDDKIYWQTQRDKKTPITQIFEILNISLFSN